MDMARKTVAELLVDVLAEAGVERIYGVPGDSLNGITDSIRVRQDISWVGVIAIPGDVALKNAVADGPRLHFQEPTPAVCPSAEELNLLADLLNRSNKITILGGAGCAGAHDELIELASKLQAPIVHALRGKEFIEYDNPFDVGMTGLLGFSSGYVAI